MATTAPPRPPSAPGLAPRTPGRPRSPDPVTPALLVERAMLVRLGAWAALALFAGHAWAVQVEPASRAAAWGAVLAGLLVVACLLAVPIAGRPRLTRWATPGAAALAVVLGFVCSGITLRLLLPDVWGELAAGVAQGLGDLPGVRVPYRGLDEWTRAVIVLGGTLLTTISAYVAFAPARGGSGRPAVATALLGVLYAVPVVERSPERPFLSGAVFAVLAATLLWAERLRRDQLRFAAAFVGTTVLLALIVAPRVDGDGPLFDYEQLVTDSLQSRNATRFDWSHDYGPLRWPRDGREVLRIKARQGSYWKAAVLGEFDGEAWRRSRDAYAYPSDDATETSGDPSFRGTVGVIVRNMRSSEYVGAGTTGLILDSPRLVVPAGEGMWRTGSQPLRRGDTYRARVYVPRPSQAQMRQAGVEYPGGTHRYLTMRLPRDPAAAPGRTSRDPWPGLLFPPWGEDGPIYVLSRRGLPALDGRERILASPYGRMYRLAQSLRERSTTPYEFVRNVRARVMRGARYTETPAPQEHPLDAFLFDTREGYCQHFSGAMALLLRMGGVPARVASGFTSGSYNARRKEWVVRDLDAHSWVEAYFPGQGWVAFDPTPEVAPPRAQLIDVGDDENATEAAEGGGDAGAGAGDRLNDAGIGDAPVAAGEDGGAEVPIPTVIGGLVLLALLAIAVRAHVRARRRFRADDPQLAELLRALRRTGRAPAPATTLAGLERALRHDEGAVRYLRAIRVARYGSGREGAVPSPADRRALREALGEGLGVAGRLRAWWALPPRLPRLRRSRRRNRSTPGRLYTG